MKSTATTAAGLLLALLANPAYVLACSGDIPPQNPDSIYVIHDNGTVTDLRSGLMWKRCVEGQALVGNTCTGFAARQNWADSLAIAEDSVFAGHDDWRLPSVKELGSLVETCAANPSINAGVFPNTPLGPSPAFWTSSPTAGMANGAWFIGFDAGYALRSQRVAAAMARLVRDAN